MTTPHDTSTPAGVEAELLRLIDQSDAVRIEFQRLRNAELEAEFAMNEAERAAEASPDAPKVGVFDVDGEKVRTTVGMREKWVQAQYAGEYEAHARAMVARQAAGKQLHMLGVQISALQTISKSVNDAYRAPQTSRRTPW